MLLIGQNIKKEYGIQTVLDVKKIQIQEGDRIGLVGRNGSGKSTLLKILSNKLECDSGIIKSNCDIACISQEGEAEGEPDSMYVSRMKLWDSAVKSGGEITRMAIASAFSKQAPLLFADEPTTNLDTQGIEELEKMLKGYRGAVVLVSHDRQLLDTVCNQIWEIEKGDIRVFPGNYTDWYEQRQRERNFETAEYEQYRAEKRRLTSSIMDIRKEGKKMGKPPRKMSSSEWLLYKGIASEQQGHVEKRGSALVSRLEHLEVKERPEDLPKVSMKLGIHDKIKAKNAARINSLSFSYDDKKILDDVSCDFQTGKKTFLTGENGSGKSTMLTCLIEKDEGTFITSDAKVGYFSQNHDILEYDKSVLENVKDTAVVPEHICRAVLANLYMQKDDLHKPVNVLSGGERVKTALAKILVSGCNFLIFDEPTNHMDIYTMEGLEKLLEDFDGTVLAVSHDRKFVQNLADVVYKLENGKIIK